LRSEKNHKEKKEPAMAEHKTVIGTYGTHEKAEAIASQLQREGFSAGQIELIDEETDARSTDGKLVDRLRAWGIPEADASSYAESVNRGESLVTLDAEEDEVPKAVRVMREEWGEQSTGAATAGEAEASFPVIEEEIHVGKERVTTGHVRVVPRILEVPVEQDVHLRKEHLRVEREPADRPLSTADMDALKEGGIEFIESEERAVVEKDARVVEEVHIAKDVEEHTEHVSDTARRQDVEVERGQGQRKKPGAGTPGSEGRV
jgi:uncharacterized protein (TIGR02271 family)